MNIVTQLHSYIGLLIYIYIYIYTHTHTHAYIYIYIHINLLHYVGLFCQYAWPYFLTIFGEIRVVFHNNT